jgi:methylase of polypeptide subunit release factors
MKNRRMTTDIAAELSREIAIVQSVVDHCDPSVKNLFRVLMSDAISRRIRMRFLGTGVGRFSLTFSQTPLPRIFANSIAKYAKGIATCEWLKREINLPFADAQVLSIDTRSIPKDVGHFDILVTSPPYLPASSGRESYAKARAISLIALGIKTHMDVDDLVDDSIGSMIGDGTQAADLTLRERQIVEWLRNDELRAIKAEPTARYFLDMRKTFSEMMKVLVPGALAVVVSGKESTFYQFSTREALYVVPAAEMLAEEAQSMGFEVEALHDVKLNKSNMNARPRSLDDYYETLIVLRKSNSVAADLPLKQSERATAGVEAI